MLRASFYDSMAAMLALVDNPLFVDGPPASTRHNTTARLLRLGLAVNCFSSLEAYIANCFEAAIVRLQSSLIQFADFPEPLQKFLVIEAVTGLANRGSHIAAGERLFFYDQAIARLAGYKAIPARFSPLGFRPKGSNVDSKDISTALKALQIDNVWARLSSITSMVGVSQIDLASEYDQLSKTRHSAAHVASSNVPSNDLRNRLRAAISIGIAIDVLTKSAADRFASTQDPTKLAAAMQNLDLRFRFIDAEVSGSYVERSESLGPVVKRYADLSRAVAGASLRSTPRYLVVRDSSGRADALVEANGTGAR